MAVLLFVILNHRIVSNGTKNRIYSSTEEIPANKIGLLLGTGKYLTNGHVNLYYKYRLDAAYELFRSGKIKYILISGDNSRKDYDEPSMMKEDLIAMGIPASRIEPLNNSVPLLFQDPPFTIPGSSIISATLPAIL